MHSKVGLIFLLSLMGSCVRGEFECEEYPLKQSDPFSPAGTVRVCGAADYEDIPKIFRTLLGIEKRNVEKPAQYLLPPFEEPAVTPKFSNGFSQNVAAAAWQSSHLPKYVESTQPYYDYDIFKEPTEDDVIELSKKQQQQNQNLDAITADVSGLKQSVDELKSQLKEVSKNMLAHKIEERNVNIVLSLDTSMEDLAKRIVQLAEEKMPKGKENDPEKMYLTARSKSDDDYVRSHVIDDDEVDYWLANASAIF